MSILKKLFYLLLICFIGVGVFVRIYKVTTIPAYHVDELAFGYNAYSISKTGADEYGRNFPLVLESFGDYKLALYSYFLLPFVKFFRLSDWIVRLPSIIFGFLTIPLVFLFIKEYLEDKKIALLSAFLLLISPWHVIYSRTANEVILQVFLIVTFFYLWLRYLKFNKTVYKITALIFLSLSILSYYSSFVFIPLITLIFFFIHSKQSLINRLMPFITTIILLLILILTQPLGRINQTSLFKHGEIQALISESLQEEGPAKNLFITRAFHNKVYMSMILLARGYFNHFTPDFLFLKGDTDYGRYSLPYTGPLYLWELPFILTGIYISVEKVIRKRDKRYLLIICWIMLAFLPNSFSFMGNNTQRTIIIIPMTQVLTALGIIQWYSFFRTKNNCLKNIVFSSFALVIIFQYLFFIDEYFVHQKVHQPWYRESYGKEMIDTLNQLAPNFKKTIIADTSPILFFFYNQTDPLEAKKILDTRTYDNMGFNHISRLGDYIFMPIECPKEGKVDVLYVCKGDKVAYNTSILKVVRYPNNQPARIFLVFNDPTKKIPAKTWERIGIFEDTITNPQIIPSQSDKYW